MNYWQLGDWQFSQGSEGFSTAWRLAPHLLPTTDMCDGDYAIEYSCVYSRLVTPFQVDFVEPFKIEPRDGTLQPFSSLKLKASFQPKVTAARYQPFTLYSMNQ